MKHTPGPWIVDGVNNYLVTNASVNVANTDIPFSSRGSSHEQRLANAKLIAASPDLLKELQHLVRLLEPKEKEGGLDVTWLATLNGARKAIAKATGSEQAV